MVELDTQVKENESVRVALDRREKVAALQAEFDRTVQESKRNIAYETSPEHHPDIYNPQIMQSSYVPRVYAPPITLTTQSRPVNEFIPYEKTLRY